MQEVEPTVPYTERPERFLLFEYNRPAILWYPFKVFEWAWKRIMKFVGPEYMAEYWATIMLISFPIAGVAQGFYSRNETTFWIGATWGTTVGVIFGMYTALGVSGAQMNPAVTFSLALVGRFPWRKVPFYWLAQCLGSFTAAVIVYLYYYDAMNDFDGGSREFNGVNETYRVWVTNPQPHVGNLNNMWDQFWSTFLLQFLTLAIFDKPNAGVPHHLRPIGVSLILFTLNVCFAYNCGAAMNPVRDFPPRCFVAMFWGPGVFTVHDFYFYVPILGPMLGAPIGTIAYIFFIETHHYPAHKPQLAQEGSSKVSPMRNGKQENGNGNNIQMSAIKDDSVGDNL